MDAPAKPANPAPNLAPPPPLDTLMIDGTIALFLDFDGTLVAIADAPDAIVVGDGLAQKLTMLADRMGGRVALISGRGVVDLDAHLGPIALSRAGSHGADRRVPDGSPMDDPPRPIDGETLQALERLARRHDALLERKAHGAAIHYRAVPDAAAAIVEEAGKIAADAGLEPKHGKCVVELVRPGASKAGAVDAFMARPPFAGARPIFVGDDVTDDDGFTAAIRHGGFGVAVGTRPTDHARYRLDTVRDVHEWLAL